MKKTKYHISNISCSNCAKTITTALKNYFKEGIQADVNVTNKTLYIKYDEKKVNEIQIQKVLKSCGHPIDKKTQ